MLPWSGGGSHTSQNSPNADGNDGLYRLLAWFERITPRPLYLWFAEHSMGPERAARIVKHLRREAVPSVVQGLSPPFSATAAPHLSDESIAIIVDKTAIETLVAVSRELVARRDFQTMARFGAQMGTSRIKVFVVELNDADAIAHTAKYYDPESLVRIVHAFSGPYAARLAEALDRLGYHNVEAELGRTMAPEHLVTLIRGLPILQIVRFLRDAPPNQVAQVMVKMPPDKRNAIGQALMDAKSGH